MASRAALIPDRPTLDAALAALLGEHAAAPSARANASPSGSSRGIPVATAALAAGAVRLPEGRALSSGDRELAKVVREGTWPVVIVHKLGAALMRAIESAPPALLVITDEDFDDDAQPGELAALGVKVLGPRAQLHVDDAGQGLICGANADQLRGLVRAADSPRMALAPTPGWLPAWLDAEALAAHRVLATVRAQELARAAREWVAYAQQPRARTDLFVPLGVPELDLGADPRTVNADEWMAAAVAHALERDTGPVFPSPRAMAQLALEFWSESQGDAPKPEASTAEGPGFDEWAQARRALPRESAALAHLAVPAGREPSASLFLAQAPARRRARNLAHRIEAMQQSFEVSEPDPDHLQRADEVIRASPEQLSEHEAKVVLRGHGFEITRQAVATSASGAAGYADRIGYPVVLKALSPSLRRRREIGALRLDLPSAASVRRAYADIVARVEAEAPLARMDGVLVAEMVPPGHEFHCGVRRVGDQFVVFARALGPGASLDPVLVASPMSVADALCTAELVLGRLPAHTRRRAGDPQAAELAEVLRRLERMAEHIGPRLLSIDLAPLRIVTGIATGIVADPASQDDDAPHTCIVLDAAIRQRPHLEGV